MSSDRRPPRTTTLGERLAKVSDNPSGHPGLAEIKRTGALLIDLVEAHGQSNRFNCLAQQGVGTVLHWAEKSILKPKEAS